MATRRTRLAGIGKAVLTDRTDQIVTQVAGRVTIDPNRHLTLKAQQLIDEDFSSKRFDSFSSIGSRFMRCAFRNIHIEDACWGSGTGQSQYVECCFDGAKFRSIAPGNARFVDCSFRNVTILEFHGHDVELVRCVFTGRIKKGYLNGALDPSSISLFKRRTNEIVGNDFRECDLRDFGFRTGIDLKQQTLPIGPQYLYLSSVLLAVQKGRDAVATWEHDETQRLATVILDIMERELRAGQQQSFHRLPDRGQFALPWQRLRQVLL